MRLSSSFLSGMCAGMSSMKPYASTKWQYRRVEPAVAAAVDFFRYGEYAREYFVGRCRCVAGIYFWTGSNCPGTGIRRSLFVRTANRGLTMVLFHRRRKHILCCRKFRTRFLKCFLSVRGGRILRAAAVVRIVRRPVTGCFFSCL